MAQQLNHAKTKTESTSAGEQHVIPGAEKISDAEAARRIAAEPLKPKIGQKPADEGLFGDWAYQIDLVDLVCWLAAKLPLGRRALRHLCRPRI
jgi:hypothetical protein